MDILVFLSSGLFLGWSLGANDAANVFGTAVGSRMVKFRTAAFLCSFFIVLGATISGSGAAHTLGQLGAVNALAGAFTVALAAALATFWMTRLKLPVSTSQAVVGAIIGWNLYASALTDTGSLTRIVLTWIACPLLSAFNAVILMLLLRWSIRRAKPHLLELDALTRYGLLIVGAFGSYSLGANNIANVMGIFLPENPFHDVHFWGLTFNATQQLFLLGSLAIGVGVVTYSQRVMRTVGGGLVRMSPVAALVVVLAHSITLFLFASARLEHWLASHGLPTFPLVPVSSSQAVIGAIIGIGLLRGGRGIRYNILGSISLGWLATPLVAGVMSFLLLFFVENVFDQEVYRTIRFRIDRQVVEEVERLHLPSDGLAALAGRDMSNPVRFRRRLSSATGLPENQLDLITELARLASIRVDPGVLALAGGRDWLTPGQWQALETLDGNSYTRSWAFHRDLGEASPEWRPLPDSKVNRYWNQDLRRKLEYLDRIFQSQPEE
ncbi:MAG: inorganic phosphate transporter [bacterium]